MRRLDFIIIIIICVYNVYILLKKKKCNLISSEQKKKSRQLPVVVFVYTYINIHYTKKISRFVYNLFFYSIILNLSKIYHIHKYISVHLGLIAGFVLMTCAFLEKLHFKYIIFFQS